MLVADHAASFTAIELQWPFTWVDRLGHDRRPIVPGLNNRAVEMNASRASRDLAGREAC